MAAAFIILAIFQVMAAYFCARCVYRATRQKWLGIVVVLMSTLVPFSFGVLRNSLKCTCLINFLCNLSHFCLGFILYFFITCCCVFVIHKINSKFNFRKLMACGFGATLLILVGGFINAMNPQLRRIVIPSKLGLRLCFLSDVHVGSVGTTTILENISKTIELMHPDLIILGGDILDLRGIKEYREIFLDTMRSITSKYKTYAVIGNHEVYSGLKDSVELLREAGINVLLDSCSEVDIGSSDNADSEVQKITIAGRLDATIATRKSLKDIIIASSNSSSNSNSNNASRKIIVVDHSPESIDESIENGAFIHLSGHTHGGQMFPLNLLTDVLYKKTGVLHKDRNTYSYITFGSGFWGPPYRVGNTPEVVLIEGK